MLFNDYIKQVEADAREWIEDNREYIDRDSDMVDELWTVDSVTGNGSGSYTFSSAAAWDNVTGSGWTECLLFDDAFIFELEGIGETIGQLFARGPETIDVTARVLALYHVDFDAIISDIWPDDETDDDETEEA